MYTIDAAHCGKRAHAATIAAGQLLHLADLALLLVDLLDRGVEGLAGVVLVDVGAGAEQVQLGFRGGVCRQPRVHPRLNGRPIRYDQHMPRRRRKRRPKHSLQNVGHSLAELRDNAVTSDHCMTYVIGGIRDLPRKVVNLSAVGRRPSRSRSTRKYKGSPNAMVFVVGQRCKAAELRNRRRPQIVGALDNFGHIRRDFIGVFLSQHQ